MSGWRWRSTDGGPDAFVGAGGRHADVGDHHVGPLLLGDAQQPVVVGAHTHHVEIGLRLDELAHALADEVVVLGQHHSDRHGREH